MRYFSTYKDVILTYSPIIHLNEYTDIIKLHFERTNVKGGFDFIDVDLPGQSLEKCYGFSEDEIFFWKKYAKNNEPLLWELAREEGGMSA